jgi:hypothetical protein
MNTKKQPNVSISPESTDQTSHHKYESAKQKNDNPLHKNNLQLLQSKQAT